MYIAKLQLLYLNDTFSFSCIQMHTWIETMNNLFNKMYTFAALKHLGKNNVLVSRSTQKFHKT